MHLSKSDFKVARTCGTKLYYKKLRYPSTNDENPYMEFLADGGYMVETIAKLLFAEGRELGFDQGADRAFRDTMDAMQQTNVQLFEATFIFRQLLARCDIVVKAGDIIQLIEVKAKSFNSSEGGSTPFRGKKGGILSDWRPYLEDVAFQAHIIRSLFPTSTVIPYLCLVDKAKICNTETSFDRFNIVPRSKEHGTFTRPSVEFIGDKDALRSGHFLEIIDVSREADEIIGDVRQAAEEFSATLAGERPIKIDPLLRPACKKCEYRVKGLSESGFSECWGPNGETVPHLLDLYRVDLLGSKGSVATQMIEEGRCGLLDVVDKDLRGETAIRQRLQLEWTRMGKEYVGPGLRSTLQKCTYPLHFVDFEGSCTAVPYHAGMRPYEKAAFQWSCHTITEWGGEIEHRDWINVVNSFPNFDFARALRDVVGFQGTVFVWHRYEKNTLKEIRQQMIKYSENDSELVNWLDYMISDSGPITDLCALAQEFYFHPQMGPSLSIKYVLPAVWGESATIRAHPWFRHYHQERDGELLDPYETLPPLPFGDDEEGEIDAVREGTAAMRTYQEMMYGMRKNDESFRNAQRQSLLNYCELDTAAMVMIWMHWCQRLGLHT